MSGPLPRALSRRRAGGVVRVAAAALLVVLALLAGGCATFPDASSQPWRDNPELGPEKAPAPQSPAPSEPSQPAPPPNGGAAAAPGPCVDPDPQVVATCLAPVSAVVTLPGGTAALVAERTTGRILRVAPDTPPQVVATVPVDATGDGGLTGLALSPSYDEDQLVYAYATTPGGNAVLRVAQGDVPKPVISGIPRGSTDNRGAIGVEPTGTLLVATGDAGNAASATAAGSLAGKLLRIDPFGRPAPGNPDPTSPVVGSGLHAPGDVCPDTSSNTTWVSDRAGTRDVLLAVRPGSVPGAAAAAAPAWTWPDRPGVDGCAAGGGSLFVGLSDAKAMYVLKPTAEGRFVGAPEAVLQNTYGRISGADLGSDGMLWLATVNKDPGGTPGATDDRVIRIKPPSGGGSGPD
ncbi:PQQ-dependent sugar dehydrogenase [Actinomycetospora endophytica]|uniref:PQQ-dependent sugar dehydrogenase n=1 Tax=Actinomycetospora endophytica TaxID=2291215 RepID=A0ABS8PFG9_9PSEU|nr:PQQ-dependent sugar dehydrogenase [Actinomycetospora endophytica]MCD2197027.1 PQQ-dependent sugar dehydrogenase [Actinomycetospora endophytica]